MSHRWRPAPPARHRRDSHQTQAKKWTDEKWAREEGKRQRGSRKGMVEEDERSRLMRQALQELEAQYDAVGAFSVTVDACVEIKCRGAISSHGSITTSTPST